MKSFKKAVGKTFFSALVTDGLRVNKSGTEEDIQAQWDFNKLTSITQSHGYKNEKPYIGSTRLVISQVVVPLLIRSIAHTLPSIAVHFSASGFHSISDMF